MILSGNGIQKRLGSDIIIKPYDEKHLVLRSASSIKISVKRLREQPSVKKTHFFLKTRIKSALFCRIQVSTKQESRMKEKRHNALVIHSGYMWGTVEELEGMMSTPAPLNREWNRYSRRCGPFSAELKQSSLSTLRAGQVFTSPEATRQFKSREARKLDHRLEAIVDLFIENPWSYNIFEVEKIESDGLLSIRCRGGDEILFSQEAARAARRGETRLLGLLFFNGQCMQSWGEIVPLDAFFEEDLHYFAGEIDPGRYSGAGLDAVIAADPLPFYLLKRYSALPQPLLYGEVARPCASSICLPDFDPERLSLCRCPTEQLDNGKALRVSLGHGADLRPPTLYLEGESGTAILTAFTLEGYRKGRLALEPVMLFPEKPQRMVSGTMQYAAWEICGTNPPWMELDESFVPDHDSPEGVALLDSLEEAVYHCIESGRSPDLDYVCERSGADPESARIFLEGLKNLIGGEVPGLSYAPLREVLKGSVRNLRAA
jgi:hypothetical protein